MSDEHKIEHGAGEAALGLMSAAHGSRADGVVTHHAAAHSHSASDHAAGAAASASAAVDDGLFTFRDQRTTRNMYNNNASVFADGVFTANVFSVDVCAASLLLPRARYRTRALDVTGMHCSYATTFLIGNDDNALTAGVSVLADGTRVEHGLLFGVTHQHSPATAVQLSTALGTARRLQLSFKRAFSATCRGVMSWIWAPSDCSWKHPLTSLKLIRRCGRRGEVTAAVAVRPTTATWSCASLAYGRRFGHHRLPSPSLMSSSLSSDGSSSSGSSSIRAHNEVSTTCDVRNVDDASIGVRVSAHLCNLSSLSSSLSSLTSSRRLMSYVGLTTPILSPSSSSLLSASSSQSHALAIVSAESSALSSSSSSSSLTQLEAGFGYALDEEHTHSLWIGLALGGVVSLSASAASSTSSATTAGVNNSRSDSGDAVHAACAMNAGITLVLRYETAQSRYMLPIHLSHTGLFASSTSPSSSPTSSATSSSALATLLASPAVAVAVTLAVPATLGVLLWCALSRRRRRRDAAAAAAGRALTRERLVQAYTAAMAAQQAMYAQSLHSHAQEQRQGGLRIDVAVYGYFRYDVDTGAITPVAASSSSADDCSTSDSVAVAATATTVDVTVPIRFFVSAGHLALTTRRKSGMLGFYRLPPPPPPPSPSPSSRQLQQQQQQPRHHRRPRLYIRYRTGIAEGDTVRHVVVNDRQACNLP